MIRFPTVNRFLLPRAAAIALIGALAAWFALSGPPSLVHAAHEPVNLALAAGSGKLAARWTAPTNLGTDTIRGYRYQYKKKADATWSTEAAVTTLRVEITGLDNGDRYEVRVRTRYQAQGSNTDLYSSYVTAESTPGLTPDAPGQPTVIAGNASLTVTWTAPNDNGSPITDYKVEYRTYSRAKLGTWTQWKPNETSTSTSTTIAGPGLIDNGTDYQVQVNATNGNGTGGWSPTSDEVTAGAPGAPAAPTLTPGQENVAATWTAPAENGAAIINYDLRYKTTGANSWTDLEPGSQTTSLLLTLSDTSDKSTGDPLDLGELNQPALAEQGLSFTRESVGTGANEKWGIYRVDAGAMEMQFILTIVGAASEVRYAVTKPTASNLTTHGKVWCDDTPSMCEENNTVNDPLLKNHYVWAFTTTGATLSTVTLFVNHIDLAREGRAGSITGLTTGTEYEGQVRASNAHGDSGWSPWATVTLTSAVGNLVATRVRGADGCSETINLTWGSYYTHGSYKVQYRIEPWYQWFDVSPDPTAREATLNNTNYWKWYKFRVRANVAGSEWSELHVAASDDTTMAAYRSGDHVIVCAPVVAGATGYHFNYTTDDRNGWTRRASDYATPRYEFRWANPRLDYWFASQADSQSHWTNSPVVPAILKPNAVASVAVKHKGSYINASWWGEPDGGASWYNVNYSNNGKQSWARLVTGHRKFKVNLVATPGKTYYFAVQACNSLGCSDWTNSPAAVGIPPSVASVSVTHHGDRLEASWPGATGATKYHVTYSSDGGNSWSLAALNHSTTGIAINNVDGTKPYIVGVRAGNVAGWSGWTNSGEVPPATPLPGGVGSVTATHHGATVSVTWTAASHSTGYDVVYSTDGKASWSRAATNQSGTTYTLNNADGNATYVFGVRAVNNAGESGWTNSAPASQ